jgi:hypothetical protein
MTSTSPEAHVADRVPQVLQLPGVARATWWENRNLDRTDLPRKLPEFSLLGVYEVDDGFVPPEPGDGVTGLHFRQCPRPGQGRMTGNPTIGLLVVLISPRDLERAQALRDWGDFVHLRHIAEAAVPGYTMITPYEQVGGGDPRFLHLYEMDTDDPEAAFQAMTPLVTERIGDPDTPEWQAWAQCPDLRILYVNTFRRLGEASV